MVFLLHYATLAAGVERSVHNLARLSWFQLSPQPMRSPPLGFT